MSSARTRAGATSKNLVLAAMVFAVEHVEEDATPIPETALR